MRLDGPRSLRVAAAADYRERSWLLSQSVWRFAQIESAQIAGGNRFVAVGRPNYHQPGAHL
jgi:hypothetical protein